MGCCAKLGFFVRGIRTWARNSFLNEKSQFSVKSVKSVGFRPFGAALAAGGSVVAGERASVFERAKFAESGSARVGAGLCISLVLDRGGTARGECAGLPTDVRIARRHQEFGLQIAVGRLFSVARGSAAMCHRKQAKRRRAGKGRSSLFRAKTPSPAKPAKKAHTLGISLQVSSWGRVRLNAPGREARQARPSGRAGSQSRQSSGAVRPDCRYEHEQGNRRARLHRAGKPRLATGISLED
jgi:hypothetical protein